MDEFFSLPWNDAWNIVPVDNSTPAPAARSYEEPWYVDTINRAIERAAQVATVQSAGYPPYPTFPTPTPTPTPTQKLNEGIQLSQTTLMLLVGGILLFLLGRRR